MSRESFFSIVIPTRNRGRLLRNALQSALRQDFEDYEIIVSDNCSEDDTGRVVEELRTSRVRYVRVDRPLSMPDHWELALDQARGEYVTFLCDDDALTAGALRRVAEAVSTTRTKLVALHSARYFGENWFDPTHRNLALLDPGPGKDWEWDSRETLKSLFKCRVLHQAPRMINSFCDRETMLRVRRESGRLFLMCPDYSFAALILTQVPSWIYLAEPLHVQGVFAEGIGSSQYYNRGEPSREFIREFKDLKLLTRVPMQVPVVTNYIAETLLMCKERMGAKLSNYHIDEVEYFIGCWQDVSLHEHNGVTVEADKQEILQTLTDCSEDVRRAVLAVINPSVPPVEHTPEDKVADDPLSDNRSFRDLGRSLINRAATLVAFRTKVAKGVEVFEPAAIPLIQPSPEPETAPVVIRGEEAGFHNILEFAEQLPGLVKGCASAATNDVHVLIGQ